MHHLFKSELDCRNIHTAPLLKGTVESVTFVPFVHYWVGIL